MKGILYLLLGIGALIEVGYHLYRYNGQPGSFLGFSIPNIPYLLIWGGLGVLFLYRFFAERKKK
ncbi:MAG: hypothetical protein AAF694_19965 [Bacteroidota bacterium]